MIACSNGDVLLESDGTPKVFWNNHWSPICGHYFWDNQYGAKKFCEQLGCYSGGKVSPVFLTKGSSISTHPMRQNYSVDAFKLGTCLANDKWGNCNGGCNDYSVGNHCINNKNANCAAGEPVGIRITCPCTCTKTSSCRGKSNFLKKN